MANEMRNLTNLNQENENIMESNKISQFILPSAFVPSPLLSFTSISCSSSKTPFFIFKTIFILE